MFPLVSIIVVNWNGRKTIRACLGSLVNLSYPSYEIIVVDNNSADGSTEIIEKEFPQVRLIRSLDNLGFAPACNIGIKIARGDYIALVTNDICPDPMWLAQLLKSFNSKKVGVAGGTIYYKEPQHIVWGGSGKIDLLTGQTWLPGAFGLSTSSYDVDCLSGGAMLIGAKLFKEVGLLDEDYFLYAEDLDFCLRAQRAGYVMKFTPEARSWHLIRMEQKKMTPKTYYLKTKNEMSVYLKHFPIIYLIPVFIYQLIIAPFFETFFFGQSALCFKLRLQAFLANLIRLRRTFTKRKMTEMLGQSKVKNRFKELFSVFRTRYAANVYRY